MEKKTYRPVEMRENPFIQELEKFKGQEVVVEQWNNEKLLETKGILKAIDYAHLNAVIMTETEKILIKNFYRITRLRTGKNANK